MAEIFSDEWMKSYQAAWNDDPSIAADLEKIAFSSNIGYGFLGDDKPTGVLVVENGKAVSAGSYNGEELNWDLRADKATWEKWTAKAPGMMGLGMAYTSRKLQFLVGDYGAMLKDPRMAGPFMKSFAAMGKA